MVVALFLLGAGCDVPAPAPSPTPEVADEDCARPPSPLRRLPATTYDRAVAALFPHTPIPPQGLTPAAALDGFENQAPMQAPSELWIEQVQQAAARVAASATADGWPGCLDQPCADAWLAELLPRAFRRPTEPDVLALYQDTWRALSSSEGPALASRLVIEAVLQDPEFLYLLELDLTPGAPLDGWQLATRLALLVWDAPPDDALLADAAAGLLDTADGVRAALDRALLDPRARDGLLELHRQWWGTDEVGTVAHLSPALAASMEEELVRLVEREVVLGSALLADVLVTNRTEVDALLAELYGLYPPDEGWSSAWLPSDQRAGLLSMPGILARGSHAEHPSPVWRGSFVLEALLCTPPGAPPAGAAAGLPATGEASTNRERYEQHTADPACAGCHVSIDGVGFAFEHFDAEGRWRDSDAGEPVDATGELLGQPVDGAVDVARLLAAAPEVRACVADQWLQYALGRPLTADDTCERRALAERFQQGDGDLRDLLAGIVTGEAFRTWGGAP